MVNNDHEMTSGHLHPITGIIAETEEFFSTLGFTVAQGPEKEEEFYNFDALNIPPDHPARDMQDTFWLLPLGKKQLLRTHTSPVQVRFLKKNKPPVRVIAPGRVFRNEATDATHEAQFYQVEALMVDHQVSLAHLKGVLEAYCRHIFGDQVSIRLRPSFFSFVEPGVEVDVSCFKCAGRGCSLCKKTGWIEILGAGLVHPNVLKACDINPEEWQGFAFGLCPDRIAMIRYGIDDIRLLYSGDLRFIKQF